jgi:deoxyribose-phosphate aldolase
MKGDKMNKEELIKIIDYTLLDLTASKTDLEKFCQETIEYGFKTVFVNPYYLEFVYNKLNKHDVKVGAPIGFSLGCSTKKTKLTETKESIKAGASELDMLMNLSAFKSSEYDYVENEIKEFVKLANGLTTKVIIESALLTKEEIIKACKLVESGGADFVKTATGFNGGGAALDDVKLMKKTVGSNLEVKAAGGIKTYQDALDMIKAGASRIGASGAIEIIEGKDYKGNY